MELVSKFPNEIYLMIIENYKFDSFEEIKKISKVCKLFYELMKKNMIELRLNLKYDSKTNKYYVYSIRDEYEVSYTTEKDLLYYQYIKTIYYDWLYKYNESRPGKEYIWKIEYDYLFRIPKNLILEDKYRYVFTFGNINHHSTLEIYDMYDERYLTVTDLWYILKGEENLIKEGKDKAFYMEFVEIDDFQDIFVHIPGFLEKNMVKNKKSPYNVFLDEKALKIIILIIMYRNSILKSLFEKMFNNYSFSRNDRVDVSLHRNYYY
jgi:hypothetical protein